MNTRIDHTCCFNQKTPACGNKEHKTCCLCRKEKSEGFISNLEDMTKQNKWEVRVDDSGILQVSIKEFEEMERSGIRMRVMNKNFIHKEELLEKVVGMKFPHKDGGSTEVPHTEFPTAKPAHESNEIFMQFSYNQAINDIISLIKGE